MKDLINRVQQQLDANHAVEADDIHALVDFAENITTDINKEIEIAEDGLKNAPHGAKIAYASGWVKIVLKRILSNANT